MAESRYSKNKRAQRDDLYREWNKLSEPYSAQGYGLLARIELVDGNTASAAALARKAATMSKEAIIKTLPDAKGGGK